MDDQIKWVPEWAETFTIKKSAGGRCVEVHFYKTIPGSPARPIEDLRAVLDRRDVGQQIRDKPLEDRIIATGAVTADELDKPPSAYHVRNPGGKWLDFYAIWDAIMVGRVHQLGDTAIMHSAKKMMAPGERDGGKDRLHDLKDMRWTISRAIEQEEQKLADMS
jgi:hypothetical protein